MTFDYSDIPKNLPECIEDSLNFWEKNINKQYKTIDFRVPYQRQPVVLTPEKGYTGKIELPVLIRGEKVATMYVLVFRPGDGTGTQETFKTGDLQIPWYQQHEEKPWRVHPRKKECIMEACFPIISLGREQGSNLSGKLFYCDTVSLEQLTVDEETKTVTRAWHIGLDPTTYEWEVEHHNGTKPEFYLTCGNLPSGERFGDPHAIYAPRKFAKEVSRPLLDITSPYNHVIQVVGCVAVTEKDNPLCQLFEQQGIIPTSERERSE